MKYALGAIAFIAALVILNNTGALRTAADWYFSEPAPIIRPRD